MSVALRGVAARRRTCASAHAAVVRVARCQAHRARRCGKKESGRNFVAGLMQPRLAARRRWAPLRQLFRYQCTQSNARHLHRRMRSALQRRGAVAGWHAPVELHSWHGCASPCGHAASVHRRRHCSSSSRLHAVVYRGSRGSKNRSTNHSGLHVQSRHGIQRRRRAAPVARPACARMAPRAQAWCGGGGCGCGGNRWRHRRTRVVWLQRVRHAHGFTAAQQVNGGAGQSAAKSRIRSTASVRKASCRRRRRLRAYAS